MTSGVQSRTRSEQIGDVLTAIEHLWKMNKESTLGELLSDYVGNVYSASDEEVEERVRLKLRDIMRGSRDRG